MNSSIYRGRRCDGPEPQRVLCVSPSLDGHPAVQCFTWRTSD